MEAPVDGGGDGNKDDQTTYNWLEMVDSFINNNAPKCGKALLGFILARKDNASDDMWVKAAEMEDNVDKKKKLLIKKLTGSPNSTLLWNKLIEYEQIDNNDHSSNKNEVNDLLLSTLLQANNNNLTNVDELWLLAIDIAMSRNESMTKINELYLKAKIATTRSNHFLAFAYIKLSKNILATAVITYLSLSQRFNASNAFAFRRTLGALIISSACSIPDFGHA